VPNPGSPSKDHPFDLASGNRLRLEDIFEPASHYFSILCETTKDEVYNKILGRPVLGSDLWSRAYIDTFSPGTIGACDRHRFEEFFLDRDKITIVIPACFLRECAAGPIYTSVDYDKLRGVGKTGGPLESILN
jgi:hypothetical protein